MDRIVVQIQGAKELDAAFALLPQAMARRTMLNSLRRASKPMVDEARRRTPKGTRPYKGDRKVVRQKNAMGPLWQSLKARAVPGISAEGVTVAVGPDARHFYSLFVHQGHDVVVGGRKNRNRGANPNADPVRSARTKKGWKTRRARYGRAVFGRIVGKAEPVRFLEAAFEATKQQVIDGLSEQFWDALQKTAARLHRQAGAGELTGKNRAFLEAGSPL